MPIVVIVPNSDVLDAIGRQGATVVDRLKRKGKGEGVICAREAQEWDYVVELGDEDLNDPHNDELIVTRYRVAMEQTAKIITAADLVALLTEGSLPVKEEEEDDPNRLPAGFMPSGQEDGDTAASAGKPGDRSLPDLVGEEDDDE